MAEGKKRIPKRRFKEFRDGGEWEERKLGELSNIKTGDSDAQDAVHDGVYPFFVRSDKIERSNKFLFDGEAILIPGEGRLGDIYHYINGKFDYHQRVYKISNFHEESDGKFILYTMQSSFKEHAMKHTVKATVDSLRLPMLTECQLVIPKYAEQKKIGIFFNQLDTLITLHQRKLDKLKSTKKAYLSEMFPAEGESKPKRRFKGFSGDWEKRELSSICSMNARIGWQNLRTSEFLDSGDYYLITGTDFNEGRVNFATCHYVEKYRYDQDKKIQVSNGSILITKDGTLGKVAYVQGLNKPATLNAGVFNVRVTSKDVDEKFLFQYLKGPFLMDYVTTKATGGTIKHLNQNILVDFPVMLPEVEEQEKIGTYFIDLDNLITLHQQKLDKLKHLKKSYLNEMFI